MIVVISSSPGTDSARSGVKTTRDIAADIALIGDAVGLARRGALEGFCGTAHAIEADVRMHGIPDAELERGVRLIDRAELERLILTEGRIEKDF